jgi:hypothetical protein
MLLKEMDYIQKQIILAGTGNFPARIEYPWDSYSYFWS